MNIVSAKRKMHEKRKMQSYAQFELRVESLVASRTLESTIMMEHVPCQLLCTHKRFVAHIAQDVRSSVGNAIIRLSDMIQQSNLGDETANSDGIHQL